MSLNQREKILADRIFEAAKTEAERKGITPPSKAQVEIMYRAVFEELRVIIMEKDEFRVGHFGTFSIRAHKGGAGRNPSTGEPADVPDYDYILFQATEDWKTKLNT